MRQMLSRILVSLGLLVACSPLALATTVYTIDMPNAALTGFTGPYAKVSVNLIDSTHASITFDSLINGGFWYLMGDGGSADAQVSSSYTLGPVTLVGASPPGIGFGAPSFLSNTPGNVSTFGVFNLSLNLFDGFSAPAQEISFTITNTSGTWASDAAVLTANASGNFAAVHAFACAVTGGDPATCNQANGAVNTGFAANNTGGGPPSLIPEPQTLALLGIGLLVLATMRRKRAN